MEAGQSADLVRERTKGQGIVVGKCLRVGCGMVCGVV